MDKKSAFPHPSMNDTHPGLTKREYFSLHILTNLISNADRHSQEGSCFVWNYEHLSKVSINAADKLIELLSSGEENFKI